MLPVRLELRNFLAYRTPSPISFEGLTLACLSGPNGAGKSSLLDAMTWALWGHARGRSDDDLIHMGHDDMHVIFDFRQDQQLFRVVRKRTKKGRGQSTLDFFLWDNEKWNVIRDGNLRETQQQINQRLHLDYETFVHSAFLQQGKADSFTVKTPAERKKILAEILGLARWEDYEVQAKESLRAVDEDLRGTQILIEDIEREETHEPALRRDLTAATQEVEQAQRLLEEANQRLQEVNGAQAAMHAAQTQLASVQRQARTYEQDLHTLDNELAQQRQRIEQFQGILAVQEEIEQGYGRLQSAQSAMVDLADKLSLQDEIKDQLNDLLRQLDSERAELEAQAGVYEDRIREAEQAIVAGESLDDELMQVDGTLNQLERRRAERDEIRANREEIIKEESSLKTNNKTLKLEMDDIKKRLEMVEQADGALCPVCGQPLDEDHREQLFSQYRVEGKSRGDAYRANTARAEEISRTVQQFDFTLRQIETELRDYDSLRASQGRLQERWLTVQQAVERLSLEHATLEALHRTLAEESYSLELRDQINRLQEQIDGLGYDRDAHSEAREALKTLRGYEAQMKELELAQERLPEIEQRIQDLEARHERTRLEFEEACLQVVSYQKDIEQLEEKVKEFQRRQAEVYRLTRLERNAFERFTSINQQLNAIDTARKRKLELQARHDALLQDQAIYEQLRDAFGKNGIPAMIIEAAIPELEQATNKLLTRMTDGRMNVRFDTQRANKTGDGVRETLDIVISDELGTRDYSLFSGGEGFRVNFALRIALSQFLARRAGARLQTLVIDEGFGSQDDTGRERLVDSINAIRDDFDLILIVTHLDELREAFPVHIEVRKTPKGSEVTIV